MVTATTLDAGTFNIINARRDLAEKENALENAKSALTVAAGEMDMPKIVELGALIHDLPGEIDRLARKIAKESGEDVVTKKSQVSTGLQVLIAQFMRTEEFANAVAELRGLSPKFKGFNVELTGNDAVEPGMINLIGNGVRKVSNKTGKSGNRPRASWATNTDSEGISSKQVVLNYGGKYWNAVFAGQTQKSYVDMSGNERQQLLVKIVEGESLVNLTKSATPDPAAI